MSVLYRSSSASASCAPLPSLKKRIDKNTAAVCDSGLVNVYVDGGNVEIVGLWSSEVLNATLNGSVFSATKSVSATTNFPAAYLIVAGEISGDSCTANVNGYSTESENPGNFTGRFDTTKR